MDIERGGPGQSVKLRGENEVVHVEVPPIRRLCYPGAAAPRSTSPEAPKKGQPSQTAQSEAKESALADAYAGHQTRHAPDRESHAVTMRHIVAGHYHQDVAHDARKANSV